MVSIKFAKLKDSAIIPSKRKEDAGYDIYACTDKDIVICPLMTKLVPTGIASVFPEGYEMQIEERGSTGSKGIKKSAGVIDSGYRGEWFIALTNCNPFPVIIKAEENDPAAKLPYAIIYPASKAIAQAVLHKIPDSESEEISAEELAGYKSERGDRKLGSSNK